MTNKSQLQPRAKLTLREKIFTGLGASMVSMSSSIWIITIAKTPELTKPTWDIADPGLTLFSLLIGTFLFYRGTKTIFRHWLSLLDKSLGGYIVYRVLRWVTVKTFWVALLIPLFLVSLLGGAIRDSPNKKNESPIEPPADGWDVASDHYYDKEPPPPFLK